MMTHEEALNILQGLRERFSAPYSREDKNTISRLYEEVLGFRFRKTSCQNCYHDAVVEIYRQLKNTTTMANTRKFWLKNGAVICSPNFQGGKAFTNHNLTDEIAREYLILFPQRRVLFSRVGILRPKAETPVEAEEKAETTKKKRIKKTKEE